MFERKSVTIFGMLKTKTQWSQRESERWQEKRETQRLRMLTWDKYVGHDGEAASTSSLTKILSLSSDSRWCHYLLKTGPDLLSFCSSAMFAPLFSKRKEKVQVRKNEAAEKCSLWSSNKTMQTVFCAGTQPFIYLFLHAVLCWLLFLAVWDSRPWVRA